MGFKEKLTSLFTSVAMLTSCATYQPPSIEERFAVVSIPEKNKTFLISRVEIGAGSFVSAVNHLNEMYERDGIAYRLPTAEELKYATGGPDPSRYNLAQCAINRSQHDLSLGIRAFLAGPDEAPENIVGVKGLCDYRYEHTSGEFSEKYTETYHPEKVRGVAGHTTYFLFMALTMGVMGLPPPKQFKGHRNAYRDKEGAALCGLQGSEFVCLGLDKAVYVRDGEAYGAYRAVIPLDEQATPANP